MKKISNKKAKEAKMSYDILVSRVKNRPELQDDSKFMEGLAAARRRALFVEEVTHAS